MSRRVLPLAVLAVVAATHFAGIITSFDSRWSIPIARSLLREGNIDLDEYPDLLASNRFYAVERIGGHFYSIYPIGASLLALPAVAALDAAGARMADGKIEKLVGSIIVGLTAAVLYLIARRSLGVPGSLLIVFIFAFCTAAWSTASRALWQHGPSMLMLTLALWLFVLARERPRAVSLAGLPLAFAYVVRPTNAVAIAVLSALVLIRHRRYFLPYLLWMLPVVVAFLLFTLSVYHALLPPYYAAGKVGHAGGFALALAGSLVSPGRGLLVFSPIFLFSVYGILLSLGRARDRLDDALAAVIALHWVMLASFPIWWGGHSFGYRLFADMVPYLTYFLIPVVARIPALSGSRRVAVAAAFAALVAISFAINYRGANARAVYAWNSDPVDVDVAPWRLWDWRDLQFARGLWPLPAGPSGTERH